MKLNCPICKKTVAVGDPEFPFCSERCRIIDLGNWATDKYVIPGAPLPSAQGSTAQEQDEDEG